VAQTLLKLAPPAVDLEVTAPHIRTTNRAASRLLVSAQSSYRQPDTKNDSRAKCRRISTICSRQPRHATTRSGVNSSPMKPMATPRTTRTFLACSAHTTPRKAGPSRNGYPPTPRPRRPHPRRCKRLLGDSTGRWDHPRWAVEAAAV
jgi:hypothetical protein